MADTAVDAKEVAEVPEKKVEEVEKKVEEPVDEPTPAENGHSEEAEEEEEEEEVKDKEESSENGKDAEEEKEEKESTENGTSEHTEASATKRKSTGGADTEAPAEGVSPEKKAKLVEKEKEEVTNGGVEAEATA